MTTRLRRLHRWLDELVLLRVGVVCLALVSAFGWGIACGCVAAILFRSHS